MAHKTLIDGTVYEITGGRCLVDGTGYSIQKGRTLIDGTGYDILSGKPLITFGIYDDRYTSDLTPHTYTHQAEEGMTWAEYCDSEYNIKMGNHGILAYGSMTVRTTLTGVAVTDGDYVNVAPTDVIKADYTYTFVR